MARQLVSISVFGGTRTPKAQGFGKTACVAYHQHNSDLYREYGELSEMESDGFESTDAGYRMVQSVFSQSPRPEKAIVVRGPLHTQTVEITIPPSDPESEDDAVVEGTLIAFDIIDIAGVKHVVSLPAPADSTTTTLATTLASTVTGYEGVNATSDGAVITVVVEDPGDVFYVANPIGCTIADVTADPDYAATLSAFMLATKDFFFVTTDVNSAAIVTAVSAWAEANKRFYAWQTNDSAELQDDDENLGPTMRDLGYEFSLGEFVKEPSQYAPCAITGFAGARDPGPYTISSKELKGVSPLNLTETQQTTLDNANLNYYIEIANGLNGLSGTYNGGLTVGGVFFLDTIHGREWWIARTKERIVTVLASQEKVDYTDEGILLLVAQVDAQNKQAVRQRLFAADPAPTVEFLPAAQVSTVDKATRFYSGLRVTAEYAGAIQATSMIATFTF